MLTLYSKANCPNCVQAKNILDSKGIEYSVVHVDTDAKGSKFLQEEGHRSVPQIYEGSDLFAVNGHFGLLRMLREGKLNK